MATNFVDTSDFTRRALLVEGIGSVHSQMQTADKITIHFQKKSNRGGDVTKVLYPLDSNRDAAIVVFEDANHRESALRHQHVFHEVKLSVHRLPPIFRSVEVEIDPVYVKLLPKMVDNLMRGQGSSRTSSFGRQNIHKLSFSSPSELRYAEEKVYKSMARQSETAHFSTGASGYADPEEARLIEQERIRHEEEFAHGNDRNRYKETEPGDEDPEDFPSQQTTERDNSGAHAYGDKSFQRNESTTDVQSRRPQDQTSRYDDENAFSTVKKNSITLDMLSYNFIRKFEKDAVDQILKKYNVKISEKNDGLMSTASFAAKGKTSAEEIQKAIDEFTTLHQTTYGKLSRKIVVCPSTISTADLERAAAKTSKVFKSKALITKIDSNPVQYVILSSSDAGEVTQHFRKEAGIPSKKKLRTVTPSPVPENVGTASELSINRPTLTKPSMNTHGSNSKDEWPPHSFSNDTFPTNASQQSLEEFHGSDFLTNEGMSIFIQRGDITKQKVDAIVSPSNSTFDYRNGSVGAAARAIQKAAGYKLMCSCSDFMKSRHYKDLPVSECVILPGFDLQCSIIHAVCPANSGPHCLQQFTIELKKTFYNCLRLARDNGIKTLAIPLIGSGMMGAPKKDCADVLACVIPDFSRMSKGIIKEVHLVNIDDEATDALKMSFNEQLPPKQHNLDNEPLGANQTEGACKGESQKVHSHSKASPMTATTDDMSNECTICLVDNIIDKEVLPCKHSFCKDCIKQHFATNYKCPICRAVCGQPKGNQPRGTMTDRRESFPGLPGYEKDGVIIICYDIPSGTQTKDHPNPGKHFKGDVRTAYLPDNREGQEVLSLLRKAFDAHLVFTIGQSTTTGANNTITWNSIHHKTSRFGGPSSYGYPDPGYLQRVKEDLAALGIS